MKILYAITRADTLAGAQVHVAELAGAMRDAGHDVVVVCGHGRPLLDRLEGDGIRCRPLPMLQRALHPFRDHRAARALRDILHDERPDLVSAHSSKMGILARRVAARADIPCIFTAHGWAFTPGIPLLQRALYRRLEVHVEALAFRIICVSDYDRDLALSAGMSAERVTTIHNGRPDIPAGLHADPGAPGPVRIAMIGRLDAQKDHPMLLRAFACVPDADLELHFIGDGPAEHALRARATRVGIADRVIFHGLQRDVAPLLKTMHVFALASRWEGFPRSTLEAMRAGLPVIVSDVGGAAEAVEEGVTGYVVPPADQDGWIERLTTLARDGALRTAMGQAGRHRFASRFTFDRMLEKTQAVYSSG